MVRGEVPLTVVEVLGFNSQQIFLGKNRFSVFVRDRGSDRQG